MNIKLIVHAIKPFKWHGMWVFDDERVGLDKEPFVAGADTMIDTAVQLKGIPSAEDGFLIVFSAEPFPDADFELGNFIGAVPDKRRRLSRGIIFVNVSFWPMR